MFKGFKDFILRGNVIDLAVAVVIGAAFNSVVTSFVKGIITPLIGVFGNPDFSNLIFTVNKSKFLIGDVMNSVISFMIVSFVIYFLIIIPMNKISDKVKKGEKVDVTTKICPECLSAVPIKAKRCKFCTSVLKIK